MGVWGLCVWSVYVCMCVCRVCMYMYFVCVCVWSMCMCLWSVYVCMYVCTYVCVFVCVVCMCVCMFITAKQRGALSNPQSIWNKDILATSLSAYYSGKANSPGLYIQSVRRKSFSSWKSGKLSHVSGGCTSNAASMSTAKSDRNVSACSTIKSDHHAKAFEMWQKNNRQRGDEYLLGMKGVYSNPHYSRLAVHPAGCGHFIVKRTAVWIRAGLSVSKAVLRIESLVPDPEVRGHCCRSVRH